MPVWQLDGSRGLRALSRGERALLGTGSLAIAVALHNWLPAIIGLIALARAVRPRPDEPSDPRLLALFLFLVAAHTVLAN